MIHWLLGYVVLARLAELALARRNTARLLAVGAREHGRSHYPLIVLLHAAWIAALAFTVPAGRPVWWPALILFAAVQPLRVWVIASLGRYWTTRVITLPGAPLVRRGPYRWIRHPNYLVVVVELAALPLAFGAWPLALLFSAANAALLAWRVRVEDRVLGERRAAGRCPDPSRPGACAPAARGAPAPPG